MRVYRGQIASLRQEIDRLRDLLSREVGPSNLESVLVGRDPNWLGRSERIELLEQTVDELQGALQERGSRTDQLSARSEHYWADSEAEERRMRSSSESIHNRKVVIFVLFFP